MYNRRANQLTEMVPVGRLQRELGRALGAGATEYLLDNTSDIRPVLMTTRAWMELAWGGKAEPNYLLKWSREEFGDSRAHVLTQLDVHLHSNRMLLDLAEAARHGSASGKSEQVAAAIVEIERVLNALRAAEYGKWAGFYQGDLFVDVRHSLAMAQAYRDKLEGKPLPPEVPISVRPADPYVTLKAYQGNARVQF